MTKQEIKEKFLRTKSFQEYAKDIDLYRENLDIHDPEFAEHFRELTKEYGVKSNGVHEDYF